MKAMPACCWGARGSSQGFWRCWRHARVRYSWPGAWSTLAAHLNINQVDAVQQARARAFPIQQLRNRSDFGLQFEEEQVGAVGTEQNSA